MKKIRITLLADCVVDRKKRKKGDVVSVSIRDAAYLVGMNKAAHGKVNVNDVEDGDPGDPGNPANNGDDGGGDDGDDGDDDGDDGEGNPDGHEGNPL